MEKLKVNCAFLEENGKCGVIELAARGGIQITIDKDGNCEAKPGHESQCRGRVSGEKALILKGEINSPSRKP